MARTDYYGIQTPVLQATSQAIRTVNGTVGTIAPEDYPDLISAMKSGTDYDNVMSQLVEETTTPAAIASFTDGANNLPVKEIVCSINPTETGTGAKSPSNPYVIGGHTELNLTRAGINLWDEEWELGTFDNSTGEKRPYSNYWRSKNRIAVLPNTTYYAATSNDNIYRYYYDKSGNYIGNANGVSNQTFTTPNEAYYLNIVDVTRNSYDSLSKPVSINYPSTDTAYHAYNGRTHHADFGQTVYGGEFVAKEGEYDTIQPTFDIYTITGNETFALTSAGQRVITSFNLATKNAKSFANNVLSTAICEFAETKTYSALNVAGDTDGIGIGNSYIIIGSLQYDNWSNLVGKKFVFELATPPDPIILPTKTQVKTLLGSNNLYHDCNGNIKVTYRANGALYVAQH